MSVQVGVLRSQAPKSVEAGLPTFSWTVANVGHQAWEHCSLTLFSSSDAVLDAPQQIDVPRLAPGQTAEVGTQVLVAPGKGDAEIAYLLEVWAGEEGALARLDVSAPVVVPAPALAAQVVYAEQAVDITAENKGELEEAGVQQVIGIQAERGDIVQAILRNTGSKAWPEGCSLQLAAGEGADNIEFHAVKPGELVHVALQNDTACRWVLSAPDGTVFGPLIQVVEPEEAPEQSPSEGWEKVEDEPAAAGDGEAAEKEALLLGCTVLGELGHTDDVMNAYLLKTYDYDLCKVIAILQGVA